MELDAVEDEEILFGEREDCVAPPSLRATAPVMDLAFHPSLPLLAAGLVTGEVELFECQGKEMVKKHLENDFADWIFRGGQTSSAYKKKDDIVLHHNHGNMKMHPYGGVTGMEFTDDGSYLVTTSSDKTISVLDCVSSKMVIHLSSDAVMSNTKGKKKLNAQNTKSPVEKSIKKKKDYIVTPNPHKHGISALNVCDENLIATGDDDGLIAIWDMRDRKPAFVYHEHGDYVSQLLYFSDACELVSSSGDTCLGVYDVKAGKVRDFSEMRKDELTCFAFINSSGASSTFIPSILCGTSAGTLPIWKYGSWRRPYDAMEGHPRECESIISFHGEESSFNHNIVLTGACDGIVRVMQMYPLRRQLCHLSARDVQHSASSTGSAGVRRQHEHRMVRRERGGEAIRRMRVSGNSEILAVSGTDAVIDFVDIRFLSDEKALDALRRKREQRHMNVIRAMEEEKEAQEARASLESSDSDSDESDDDTDSDSEDDSSADGVPPVKRSRGEKKGLVSECSTKKKKKNSKSDASEPKKDVDWMEEYQLDRAKKRERVAAARWLKEEKKKKVNFNYEKRRRRVGGFFSDLQN